MMAVSKAEETDGFAGGTDRHIPVLYSEMLGALSPLKDQIFIDGTFGAGGYSRGLLEAGAAKVIGIDRDPNAVRDARPMLREFGPKLEVLHGRYSKMDELVRGIGVKQVDGVVLDIGVSSMQLDEDARGFSFMRNGPLDMRMSQEGPTAADLVNGLTEEEIANVLYRFGEERKSRHIARAIVERRGDQPFTETGDLAKLIEATIGKNPRDKIHPATRSFQALRIYLNDELGELLAGLNAATRILAPQGRLVIVSFHSLEDRIVKTYLRHSAGRVPNQSRHLPDVNKETPPCFQIINSKAVKAKEEEMQLNRRARSAVLRSAIRTEHDAIMFDELALNMKSLQL